MLRFDFLPKSLIRGVSILLGFGDLCSLVKVGGLVIYVRGVVEFDVIISFDCFNCVSKGEMALNIVRSIHSSCV